MNPPSLISASEQNPTRLFVTLDRTFGGVLKIWKLALAHTGGGGSGTASKVRPKQEHLLLSPSYQYVKQPYPRLKDQTLEEQGLENDAWRSHV
jgi:hypothetical protein